MWRICSAWQRRYTIKEMEDKDMLTLIDDYCAQSNNYGYTVMRDTGKTNKKNRGTGAGDFGVCWQH